MSYAGAVVTAFVALLSLLAIVRRVTLRFLRQIAAEPGAAPQPDLAGRELAAAVAARARQRMRARRASAPHRHGPQRTRSETRRSRVRS